MSTINDVLEFGAIAWLAFTVGVLYEVRRDLP